MNEPKVAIVYLSFHSEPYLAEVISGLRKMSYPKDKVEFVVVDNLHPEHGSSAQSIETATRAISGVEIPRTTILPQSTNTGFAGGNNIGIAWALEHGCDYVYLHNQDGFMDVSCLEQLVAAMEADSAIGSAQSLIMLFPETDKVNSSGNSYHYLGFGYTTDYGTKKENLKIKDVQSIGYGSGASLLFRASLLKKYGAFDEYFFAYHEDVEYGLRMRATGYKNVVVAPSLFYHQYSFSRNRVKFYYMERNRYGTLLMYYRWPTLVLLLPMLAFMELGMIYFYIRQGWFDIRWSVYGYWVRPQHWKIWLEKRKAINKIRTVTDRELLASAVSEINFGEKDINTPLVRYVANPLAAAYWWLVKRIIFW